MTTGLPVFDTTLQETNLWLKDLEASLGVPRRQAYEALRATLHALRDRLAPETAMHFSDQLPMLLRGVYAEGWKLAGKPTDERAAEAFLDRIAEKLPPDFPQDLETVARAVFQTIRRRMDIGEIDKVLGHLPTRIRELWVEHYV